MRIGKKIKLSKNPSINLIVSSGIINPMVKQVNKKVNEGFSILQKAQTKVKTINAEKIASNGIGMCVPAWRSIIKKNVKIKQEIMPFSFIEIFLC